MQPYQYFVDLLEQEVQDNPYGIAVFSYILVCIAALYIATYGITIGQLFVASFDYPVFAEPPLLEAGYIAGLLCGASIVFLATRLERSEHISNALQYLEARISTQKYPKYGDNE